MVYYATSTLWPARETYLDAAITPDNAVPASEPVSRASEDALEKASFEKDGVRADVVGARA